MRRLGVLLLGVVLIGAALGAFGYRQITPPDRIPVAEPAPAKSAPVRTVLMRGSEISYPIDNGPSASDRPANQVAKDNSPIEMFNFIFNFLNVVVGVMGVWFAGISLRGVGAPRHPAT